MMPVQKYIIQLFFFFMWMEMASAQTIQLNIADTSATTGEMIQLPVYVETSLTGEQVTSYHLQIEFLSSRLTLDTVTNGGTLSADFTEFYYHISGGNTVTIAAAGDTPLSGTGVLLYLHFSTHASGYAGVEFTGTAENYLNEGEPALSLIDGSITISDPPPITVSPNSGLLLTGEQLQFSVSGGEAPYTWSVSDDAVASISETGLLTAEAPGLIRVIVQDNAGAIDYTNDFIEVRPIRLSIPDTSAYQGQVIDIPINTTALNGLDVVSGHFSVTFNSTLLQFEEIVQSGTLLENVELLEYEPGDGQVVVSFAGDTPLSGEGVLLYLRLSTDDTHSGTSTLSFDDVLFNGDIFAITDGGNCTVTTLYTLNISPNTATLVAGDTRQFTVSGGTAPYTWAVSDDAVAEISESGLLTAVSGGQIRVTATDAIGASGVSGIIDIYDTHISLPDTAAAIATMIRVPMLMQALPEGEELFSIHTEVDYEVSSLELMDVQNASTMTNDWLLSFHDAGGTVQVSVAGSDPLTTGGILYYYQFRVLPDAVESHIADLEFQNILLNEGSPRALTQDGSVEILPLQLPEIPELVFPENGAEDISLNPRLRWHFTNYAQSYVLQVASDEGFTQLVADESGIIDTSVTIYGLDELTDYYWRVQAVNSLASSEWSEAWSFQTGEAVIDPPDIPVLLAPPNGAENVAVAPLMRWESAARAETYTLQISQTEDFSVLDVNITGIADTSYTSPLLQQTTLYYWRIRAVNEGGASDWSAVWSFQTETLIQPPETPVLASPEDGSTEISLNPQLTWHAASGANSYTLQLSLNEDFSTFIVNEAELPDTFLTVFGLQESTLHYWRVLAVNETGSSDWSAVFTFTTRESAIDPPETPLLVLPENGAENVSIDPQFLWHPSERAETYRLQVADNDGFTAPNLDVSSFEDTLYQAAGLDELTVYYWRVQAVNEGGVSDWSAVWNFQTEDIPNPPLPPQLIFPPNESSDVSIHPEFGWHASVSAQNYHFQLARTVNFYSPEVDSTGIMDTILSVSSLLEETVYYWRVSAVNAAGESDWSAVWSFQTESGGMTLPEIPQLALPVNGAEGVPINPNFFWHPAERAEEYSFELALDAAFSNIIDLQEQLTDTVASVAGLPESTIYYWRVQAHNEAGSSGYSDVWQFTTGQASNQPAVFNVGILQHPLYTNQLDIYIIGEEALLPDSLSAEAVFNEQTTALQLSMSGNTGRFFVENNYMIHGEGLLQLNIRGQYSNSTLPPNDTTITISVILPEAGKDITIASLDENFCICISGCDVNEKMILLKEGMNSLAPLEQTHVCSVYSLVTVNRHLQQPADIRLNVDPGELTGETGQIAVLKNGEWHLLPTTINRSTGELTAQSDYLGTFGVINASDTENEETVVIESYQLYPNFPNPFNPSTRIRFTVKEQGRVKIKVYDLLGQSVKTLVDRVLGPHEYTILWDATDQRGRPVSSGIYICMLEVNGFRFTQKMVLLR